MPGPGDLFGRYRIEGALGQGGMGVVLSAVHLDLGRQVALKLLAPQLVGAPDMVARFRREAQALARLDSRHVVQVYDAGEHDGWVYIATQLIPDGDLADLVLRRGPLPPADAVALIDQVLSGLADAHAVDLLHRDVKPSNVLLRQETSGGGRVYLCDFGIAQALDITNLEQTQGVIGTWAFLAPERFDGVPASASADLYATGCVLWFLVTGRLAYEGTMIQLAVAHQREPVPQLLGADPWSRIVNQLLVRAMAKDPADRFASAQEMQAALRAGVGAAVADLAPAETIRVPQPPTQPGPAGTFEATSKRGIAGSSGDREGRRGRRRVALVAAAVLLIVGGGGAALAITGVFTGENEPAAGASTAQQETAQQEESTEATEATSTTPTDGPRCWNTPDRVVDGLEGCSEAFGLPGLFWAYPTLTRDGACYDASNVVDRPALWKCNLNLADGTPVEVNYSLWGQPGGGVAHYRQEAGGEPQTLMVDGRPAYHRWRYYDAAKRLEKIAILYIDYRFGVTIYVPRGKDPRQAIDEGAVRWRQPSQMRGVTTGAP